MYELLYTSLASDDVTDDQLARILEQSRVNNDKRNITGMLIHTKKEYVQLLEGEQEAVKALYEKIAADKRHREVQVFYEGPIQERSFSNWSMASQSLNEAMEKSAEIKQIIDGEDASEWFSANPNTGKRLFTMLRDFI